MPCASARGLGGRDQRRPLPARVMDPIRDGPEQAIQLPFQPVMQGGRCRQRQGDDRGLGGWSPPESPEFRGHPNQPVDRRRSSWTRWGAHGARQPGTRIRGLPAGGPSGRGAGLSVPWHPRAPT